MTTIILSFLLLTGAAIYLVFTRWVFKGLNKLNEEPILSDSLPTVSVVLPARNEAHNIEETLESLAGQDYPRDKFEVIIVNDRSEDATSSIISRYARKYDNFIKVDIDNLPPNISPKKNAVEWGVAASKGEIIA
ncbi:MAG: glycosyltransferase, partial [FCB group bacterium]|nr:glycosyltransferase [FCB group bacterium]